MAYIDGERNQMALMPNSIEEYISADDPVRAYDAMIETIFSEINHKFNFNSNKPGANEYHPKTMLKILVYSYSYGVRSSRKIERNLHHNLSYIWLSGGIKPDHWTISDYRKRYRESIKDVIKACAKICMKLGLIEGNVLFVDGSKFRANASIANTWTKSRCEKALEKINERITKLLDECEAEDNAEKGSGSYVKMRKELCDHKELAKEIENIMADIEESGKDSINTMDPDSVKTKSSHGSHSSYNVQLVTDEKNGLIVSAEAESSSTDHNEFCKQMNNAEEITGKKAKAGCADAGYSSIESLKNAPKGMKVVVPTNRQMRDERTDEEIIDKSDFEYDENFDVYRCPANRVLTYSCTYEGNRQYKMKGKICQKCIYYGKCTKNKLGRVIVRSKDEKIKEKFERIYMSKSGQKIYSRRKEVSELPFGHIRRNMGFNQFSLRSKSKANCEVSILATCFNITRMTTILGVSELISKLSKLKSDIYSKIKDLISSVLKQDEVYA